MKASGTRSKSDIAMNMFGLFFAVFACTIIVLVIGLFAILQ